MMVTIAKFIDRRGPKVRGRNSMAMVRMSDGSKQKVPIESVSVELLPKRKRKSKAVKEAGMVDFEWWERGFDSDWD